MNGPRIASLCTGYGGLDQAVESVLGGELAFVADNDPGAAKILAHHYPDVPNHGDITTIDWGAAGPVDILTAGFPCQDVSCAGGRAGLREGNRTGVWAHVSLAIDALRPSLVVLENVRGLLSAGADSDLEFCAWCLGEAGNEHALRACGAVLGDLADIFYDARGAVVSAADAGAPHRRERVFIVARPAADTDSRDAGKKHTRADRLHRERTQVRWRSVELTGPDGTGADGERAAARQLAPGRVAAPGEPGSGADAEDPDRATRDQRRLTGPGEAEGGRSRADTGRPGGTPVAADAAVRGRDDRIQHAVEPGPAGRGITPAGDAGGGDFPAADTRGEGLEVRAVEPDRDERPATERGRGDAPADTDSAAGGRHGSRSGPSPLQGTAVTEWAPEQPRRLHSGSGDQGAMAWGAYGPAIARWEAILGWPAPRPTEPGRTGERLSPAFVEWLMGLPEGWVTGVPGLSRNAQLKALGNGVVPQQAAMALRLLLARTGTEKAA